MESSCVTSIQLLTLSTLFISLTLLIILYVLNSRGARNKNTTSPPPPPPPHEPYQDISKRLKNISDLLPGLRWIADQDSEGADPSPDLIEVRQQVSLVQLQVVACQLWLSLLRSEGGDLRAEGGMIREEITKLEVRTKIATKAGLRCLNGSVDSPNLTSVKVGQCIT